MMEMNTISISAVTIANDSDAETPVNTVRHKPIKPNVKLRAQAIKNSLNKKYGIDFFLMAPTANPLMTLTAA